ncbi:MAG: hypothetical protein BWX70_01490 [Verrucomicrobia bacterium ADurb.Bin070]|nr:MAG: hypothetical protein BWX70_01490 [Verrucomicrobia bacterium ADurb.Bin070]
MLPDLFNPQEMYCAFNVPPFMMKVLVAFTPALAPRPNVPATLTVPPLRVSSGRQV